MSHVEIPLTKGFFALVDRQDEALVAAYKWHVVEMPKHRYAATTVSGRRVQLHRMLLDAPKGAVVDHINNNGLDNRRSNIRVCSASQNAWNSVFPRAGKYKGVYSPKPGIFVAKAGCKYIGSFSTEIEAALAYNEVAQRLGGEFARLNEIPVEVLHAHFAARVTALESELRQAREALQKVIYGNP
ncbi:HNH endonuclease [Nevskia sp.]|uniref:HNH endonuclease n=1 Tax=Nevskia sp. TaxID=1929292 RepID=UPI0025E6DF13|nr:HNH endonuclease [Nevskia sp.]